MSDFTIVLLKHVTVVRKFKFVNTLHSLFLKCNLPLPAMNL